MVTNDDLSIPRGITVAGARTQPLYWFAEAMSDSCGASSRLPGDPCSQCGRPERSLCANCNRAVRDACLVRVFNPVVWVGGRPFCGVDCASAHRMQHTIKPALTLTKCL